METDEQYWEGMEGNYKRRQKLGRLGMRRGPVFLGRGEKGNSVQKGTVALGIY